MVLIEKCVELEIIETYGDRVTFRIKKQSESLRARRNIIARHTMPSNSTQYCSIVSESFPEVSEERNMFIIRGKCYERDNQMLNTTKLFFNKIKRTLKNKINKKIKCIY